MQTSFQRQGPARDPLIGCVLHDRYKVEKRIGKGGMGIVYLAEHVLLRRKVALKTLSERAFASEELIARFHREAVAAAALGNEHICGVTDMGQLDDGSYFVVLEYLDGVELAYAVEEHGSFSVSRAARAIMQLCDALDAVHEAGIVHRDLKPENLFLIERNGAPDFLKVLDFGVCKVLDEQRQDGKPLTGTGVSLGTPQYMAPEQIESSASVDARTDIYAAGAILYFALTGKAPFDDTTLPRLILRICSEPPPALRASRPEMPPALEAIIARAMQRRPEDRFQSAAELRAALEPFASYEPCTSAVATAQDAISTRALPRVLEPSTLGPSTLGPSTLRAALPKWRLTPRNMTAVASVVLAAGVALLISALVTTRTPQSSRDGAAREPETATAAPTSSAGSLKLDLSPVDEPLPARALRTAPEVASASARTTPARSARVSLVAHTPDRVEDAVVAAAAPPASDPPPAAPPPVSVESQPERAAPPPNAYRLSQRELKDVFP